MRPEPPGRDEWALDVRPEDARAASALVDLTERSDEPFLRFAVAGLSILFGLQSAINMAVNLHLMPAKGMTLPFISYGGSSMISLAYGMGMLLALTRERPRAQLLMSPGEPIPVASPA